MPSQKVKFTCQLGYHFCSVHNVRWTQKQHNGDLNNLELKDGGWLRCVHMKNAKFTFRFPDGKTQYSVDARRSLVTTTLDFAQAVERENTEPVVATQLMSSMCKLIVATAADGKVDAKLRIGHLSLGLFPVDLDTLTYLYEGVEEAIKDDKASQVISITTLDGQTYQVDARGKKVSLPMLDPPMEDVASTSIRVRYVFPTVCPQLDKVDADRVRTFKGRTDWETHVGASGFAMYFIGNSVTNERDVPIESVRFLNDAGTVTRTISTSAITGAKRTPAKEGPGSAKKPRVSVEHEVT